MASILLRPVAPAPPDFHLCDPFYGLGLSRDNCEEGLARLPGGGTSIPFSLINQGHPVSLPISITYGSCLISVEVGGPTFPDSVSIVPNNLRSMASWVIEKCVISGDGMGGFVTSGFATSGFANMVDYIIANGVIPNPRVVNLPSSTAFIVLNVTHPENIKSGLYSAGNKDPTIALVIGEYVAGMQGTSQTQSNMRKSSSVGADLWNMAGVGMSRDGSNDWWLAAPRALKFPGEMAYECDPTLGKPALTDCAHI